jgi:PKD repeat protein
VGQTVAFDGTGSSVPAPGPVSYAWTFGDGMAASGPTTTHAFPAKGSYPVTLTVTDAGGRSSSVTHLVTTTWGATDLAVSVGGSVPTAGRYAYRVTVKNLGATAAHRVVLLNTLDPTQVLAVRASAPAGLSCGGVALGATGTLTCTAGSSAVLAPGKSWVVTFTVKQPSAPRVRMVSETSRVSADNADPVAANNSATRSTVLAVKR